MRTIAFDEISQKLKDLDIYGYTKIENYLGQQEVNRYLELVEKNYKEINSEEKIQYKGTPDRDRTDGILYNLQNKDKLFVDLISSEAVEFIAKEKLNDRHYRFLPEDAPNYILLYYNARSSGSKLDLHIDSHIPFLGKYTTNMQFAFLLEDMDESNGCTVVLPGSHQAGSYTDREMTNLTPVCAKAGDLICWDSRIWHGTKPNESGRSRWMLIATLGMWWMKPSMDIPRSLPESIYSQLNDKQKALMGYCSMPPVNEFERNNTKCGYDFLKPRVEDYYS